MGLIVQQLKFVTNSISSENTYIELKILMSYLEQQKFWKISII